jgi:malonate transporter
LRLGALRRHHVHASRLVRRHVGAALLGYCPMILVLNLVIPVFGLIALGFASAKLRYLSDGMAPKLNEFAFKVVMPALLFRAMATAADAPGSLLPLVAAYLAGMGLMWVVATLAGAVVLRRSAPDAVVVAMATCFGNGVMLGFPLILTAFGPEAATPMAFVAMCETVCLWLLGTLHMELALSGFRGVSLRTLGMVLIRVLVNPIVFALLAGLAWRYAGLGLPELPARIIDYLAQAGIPVALFGLGMSLAAYELRGAVQGVGLICILRLILYPALGYWLAHVVFGLPDLWTGVIVLYVAMPVGANAFLFAAGYGRAVGTVSAAVAISTMLAVLTVTGVLTALLYAGLYVAR